MCVPFSTKRTASSGRRTSGTPRKAFCWDRCGKVPSSEPHMWCLDRRISISILQGWVKLSYTILITRAPYHLYPRRKPCYSRQKLGLLSPWPLSASCEYFLRLTTMAATIQDAIMLFGDSITQGSWEQNGIAARLARPSPEFIAQNCLKFTLERRLLPQV